MGHGHTTTTRRPWKGLGVGLQLLIIAPRYLPTYIFGGVSAKSIGRSWFLCSAYSSNIPHPQANAFQDELDFNMLYVVPCSVYRVMSSELELELELQVSRPCFIVHVDMW
jgi:hypothetical protein